MTEAEARTVAEIMTTADSGCYICSARLIEQLGAKFPKHQAALTEVYRKRWPKHTLDFEEGE